MPANPDLGYIYCEKCKKWIHMACVGLSEDQAKGIDYYVCPKCSQLQI
jgi:hypothetical protein